MIAAQRFLANNRNLLRDAVLTAASVLAVENKVQSIATARKGKAQVSLTGTYTGTEEATYDIEIVDTNVDVNRVSQPTFTGAGTGTLTDITASSTPQIYTVECNNAGTPASSAEIDVEGSKIRARVSGDPGNLTRITVDQSTLVFTASNFSLLADLGIGGGSAASPLIGQGYDWDDVALTSDGLVPLTAHRIAFGDDKSAVHLSFKQFVAGQWQYRLVPTVARVIPKGTRIYFVTGGRDVAVSNGTSSEDYPDIETAYDLLNALRTQSLLVEVIGVVANDRAPTGQAARELSLRTDAHAEVSTGSGSKYATGFVDVTVTSAAPTELITATCYASSASDHPLATLGKERWALKGSLSGDLGTIVTGEPYTQPSAGGVAGHFGLTVPIKLPPGFGTQKGRFAVQSIDYMVRNTDEPEPPPICPVSLSLGPEAVDETITLRYVARPSGDCDCSDMDAPNLGGACLGNPTAGGADVSDYSNANRARLIDLYVWLHDAVVTASGRHAQLGFGPYQQKLISFAGQAGPDGKSGVVYNFNPEPLRSLVKNFFEPALKLIDDLPHGESPPLAEDGETAWDAAVTKLKADIDQVLGQQTASYPAFENLTAGDAVVVFTDNDSVRKVRKAVSIYNGAASGPVEYGFVLNDFVVGSPEATVYFWGINNALTSLTGQRNAAMSGVTPGAWIEADTGGIFADTPIGSPDMVVASISTTEIYIDRLQWMSAFGRANGALAERYKSDLDVALITAGISPLGKTDASSAMIESGDGCWQNYEDASWWEVVGSVKGGYAPLFTNRPYWACRPNSQGRFFSTHEFALQLNVKCPSRLKHGDRVTLSISDASWGATYQRGDELLQPIVAAGPLYLSGGRNGDPTQTWNPSGSVDGPLPAYAFNPDAPVPYAASGLGFTMTEGGIPYARGDRYRFAVEGGHYRWRKNDGPWVEESPLASIPTLPAVIDDGLSAAFVTGASGSFVAGDIYRFRALQPWAVSNMQSPKSVVRLWKWGGDATLVGDLGSVEQLDMIAMLLSLPDGATATLEGGVAAGVYTWSEDLTYLNGQIWKSIDRAARYVRLTFTAAAGGSLRYAWLGQPIATELSADVDQVRQYAVNRGGSGLLQGGRYLGKGIGVTVVWPDGRLGLSEDEAEVLAEMVDYTKEHNDEPIILIPQVTRTTEPFVFGIINADQVEFRDAHGYQPNANKQRKLSATIPVTPVWQ